LPSVFASKEMFVSVPSAFTVCPSTLYLVPSDSIVVVLLLGAGPGSYFDFAGFIFQVPLFGSSAAFTAVPFANSPNRNPKIKMLGGLCRVVVPPQVGNRGYLGPQLAVVSSLLGRPLSCVSVRPRRRREQE
jgi:hypothetical protein